MRKPFIIYVSLLRGPPVPTSAHKLAYTTIRLNEDGAEPMHAYIHTYVYIYIYIYIYIERDISLSLSLYIYIYIYTYIYTHTHVYGLRSRSGLLSEQILGLPSFAFPHCYYYYYYYNDNNDNSSSNNNDDNTSSNNTLNQVSHILRRSHPFPTANPSQRYLLYNCFTYFPRTLFSRDPRYFL